MTRSVARSLCT